MARAGTTDPIANDDFFVCVTRKHVIVTSDNSWPWTCTYNLSPTTNMANTTVRGAQAIHGQNPQVCQLCG